MSACRNAVSAGIAVCIKPGYENIENLKKASVKDVLVPFLVCVDSKSLEALTKQKIFKDTPSCQALVKQSQDPNRYDGLIARSNKM